MSASTMPHLATEKQISYLTDLLATRECDPDEKTRLADLIVAGELEKKAASAAIDLLKEAPRKTESTLSPMQRLLSTVPKSKYAVPTEELICSESEGDFSGDLVFIELKEFMGTLYVRQLVGAPGRFSRLRMTSRQTKDIMAIVATDPYNYAKLFGEHYSCCGSCGAELTDQKSRELMLGPECRKKFYK